MIAGGYTDKAMRKYNEWKFPAELGDKGSFRPGDKKINPMLTFCRATKLKKRCGY
jgi:hypothetical protein